MSARFPAELPRRQTAEKSGPFPGFFFWCRAGLALRLFSVSGCRRFAIEPVSGAAEGLVSKAPTNFCDLSISEIATKVHGSEAPATN